MASTSGTNGHSASFRGPLPGESKPHKKKKSYKLPRMVEGFAKVVKYALFLANIIILICGISVFAVGVWTLADKAFMERLLGSELYVSSASILIATGVIVTLISFLGCFGAIKEIKCMLLTFFIILFMIFIVMLVGGILGYVFRNEVEEQMHKEMQVSIPKYGEETAVTDAWDAAQEHGVENSILQQMKFLYMLLQISFKCCGISIDYQPSYSIWRRKNKYLETQGKTVPNSCCRSKEEESIRVCQGDAANQAYKADCYIEMKDFVKDHAMILGGIGIGISCVLIVGMMLSCALFLMIN